MLLPPLVAPADRLSGAEAARTARHAALYPLGEIGQRRLRAAHVAIVGAGGLGSPAVLALAAAGVGRITVIDDDVVEHSNLQRQVIHRVRDVDAPKVDSAVRAAADLAPECTVAAVARRLTADNATEVLSGADLVLDGTDSFDTRLLVAAACESLGVPLVWGVVQEFHAQVTVFWSAPPAGTTATRLSDLYPAGSAGDLPSCADVGVLGALVMHVGSIMATQAILLITGIGEPLVGRIALVDALRGTTREVPLTGSSGRPGAASPEPVEIRAADLIPDTMLLIDVRAAGERERSGVTGAMTMPLSEILRDPRAAAERISERAAGRDIVTVCAAGVRSARATAVLAREGLRTRSLAGGIAAWNALGSADPAGDRAGA